MVEVFNPNAAEKSYAAWLVEQTENSFPNDTANFDLDDCNRIPRIKSHQGAVDAGRVF